MRAANDAVNDAQRVQEILLERRAHVVEERIEREHQKALRKRDAA